MNNDILTNSTRFIVLVLLQVLLLNNINLFGFSNPMLYVLFIIWYPFKEQRILFIGLSFLLGLTIDMFGDTGGIHAGASVFAAYLRPLLLRLSFGTSYEFQTIKLGNTLFAPRFTYVSLLILTHHLVLYSLEIFSFNHLPSILIKTGVTGFFTLLISMLVITLFSPKKS